MPVMYDDYPDPWGWGMLKIGKNPIDFKLSDCKNGVFEGLKAINVVEDGDILTEIESLYELNGSYVRVDYKVYKDMPFIDVGVEALWNEKDKALKLRVPSALKGAFFGQIPYATDKFEKDGNEITAQRFIGVEDGENACYIANDGVYSFSMDGDDVCVTLLRGIAYCAHPIGDRPLLEKDRFIEFAETGKHFFNFRIGYCKCCEIENAAQEFVTRREGLNYFPHGKSELARKFTINNKAISLSACYYEQGKTVLRLFNNNENDNSCVIEFGRAKAEFAFGKYEVKTIVLDEKVFKEKETWL